MIAHVLATMPVLNSLFPMATLVLSDKTNILYYHEGDVKLDLIVGNPVNKGSVTAKTLEAGKTIRQSVAKEQSRFGLAFNVISVPIYDEKGKIEGALTVILSRDKEERISIAAEELAASVIQMNDWAQHIANNATQLSDSINEISINCQKVVESVDDNSKIVDVVKSIANQSNMLGINAAIQAAHAGEYGRSFGVVANEIRTLAERSRESSENILKSMTEMKTRVNSVMEEVEEELVSTREMASGIQQINAAIQQLQTMAIQLKDLSRFQ
ncbi:methyl-accepting chemotaxis protein [Effusibacillus dendaii]|uniref:methyl-accepting chemotaxis protein n=1 Tax=Effusibacillus dendaii TaxID=2743772 RepID=UPI00190E1F80|nr:methyl-accepting chemotaxis protein [Effusibacillus dendaii]